MKKKVLIIRFNSIGDLVLTTPVIDALYDNDFEIHYLVKEVFSSILIPNPKVKKVWTLDDNLSAVVKDLKKQNFNFVIDLHNNFRSKKVASALKVKKYTFYKPRIKYWLMTKLGIKSKSEGHIVDRFLKVISPIIKTIEKPKVSFHFSNELNSSDLKKLPEAFVAVVVGTAFKTKTIPVEKLINVIDQIDSKFVLIGGPDDVELGKTIENQVTKPLTNLVGQLSINDSARVIEKSDLVLTGDTGMMHISAAMDKKIVAVFGSTHPVLGYSPYSNDDQNRSAIIQNESLNCRPCTKQGRHSCPKGHFKCMRELSIDKIVQVVQEKLEI
ncbi:MAG: glycosyltransferase family 9 protein [Saprospiraceae bacterium]|nr:glycosyltransferase family 9 protein [Saprospiraceae bacterium]